MSTICCLTVPSNSSSLPHPSSSSSHSFKDNSNIIFNRHLSPMSATQPFVFLTDNIDVNQIDLLHENDKLLLPHSTRHLKRRTSIFEKSRDWVRTDECFLLIIATHNDFFFFSLGTTISYSSSITM